MRIDVLTKEYPPEIYGGAGVHVTELVRALRKRIETEVHVHAFGERREGVDTHSYDVPAGLQGTGAAFETLATDLAIAAACSEADIVHSHTWYANMAGHLAKLNFEVPHVVTAHSLEPLRPWKEAQLGGGYHLSSWIEKTAFRSADAVVAVSSAMRDDVLRTYPKLDPGRVHVVHNGIDTEVYSPVEGHGVTSDLGLRSDLPMVMFVGRVTRQKGLRYLLKAVELLPDDIQVVLYTGASDTPDLAKKAEAVIHELSASRPGLVWLPDDLPRPQFIALLSAATAFVCPSIYEPLGIVNLEAMACGTAVVASAVGGIPEVVVDGVTGRLVPVPLKPDGRPVDKKGFVRDLADAIVEVVHDEQLAAAYGRAGRQRVVDRFTWDLAAKRTSRVYEGVL